MGDYDAYLRSEHWDQVRSKARARGGHRCKVCGKPQVDVHHKTYSGLGEERQHQLVLLCREHHQGVHDFIRMWRERGYRPLSTYSLTWKYVSRERKKLKKKRAASA